MVWSDYLPNKSLLGVTAGYMHGTAGYMVGGRQNLMLAQVQVFVLCPWTFWT